MRNIHIGKIFAIWMATSTFVTNNNVVVGTTITTDAKVVVTDESQHHEHYHSLLRTTMEEVLTTTTSTSQNTKRLYQRISSNKQRSPNRRRHLKHKKKKKEEEDVTTESVETLDTGRVEENDGSSTSPSPTIISSLPTTAIPSTSTPTIVPTVSPMSTEEFDTEPLPTFFPTSNPTSSDTESPSPDVASTMRTLSDSPSPTSSFVPTSSSSPTTLDDVEEDDDDENDEIRSRALMTATTKVYITTLSKDERQAMERTIDINSNGNDKRNTTQIAIDGGYGDSYIVASDLLDADKGSKLLDAVVTTVINMLEEHVVHGTIHYYKDNRMLKKKESLKDLRLTYGGITHDVFNIQNSGLYWIEIVLPFDVTSSSSDETFISDHKLLELQDEMFNTIKNEIRNGSFIKSLQKQDSRIQDVTTTTTSDNDENSTASSEKVKESNEDYDEEEKEKEDIESSVAQDDEDTTNDEDNSENSSNNTSTLGAATVGKRTSTDDSKRSPFPPLRIAGLLLLIATITIGAALPVLAKRHRLAKEAESEGDGDGNGNNNNRTIKKRFTLATNEGVNDFLKRSVRTKLMMTDSSNNSSSTSRTLKATGGTNGILKKHSGRGVKLNDTEKEEVGEYDHVTRNHVLEVTGVVTTTNSRDGGRSYSSSHSSSHSGGGLDAGSWGDDDDEGSEASFTYGSGGSCMISEFRTAYSEEYDDVPESLMDIHFTDTTTPSGIMDYHMSGPPAPPPSLREQMKRDQDNHGGPDLVRVLSFP